MKNKQNTGEQIKNKKTTKTTAKQNSNNHEERKGIKNNKFNNERYQLKTMSNTESEKDKSQEVLEKLKKEFLKEVEGITDIEELKEVYAREIARRDKLLAELQEKNDLLFKSAIKNKIEELKHK